MIFLQYDLFNYILIFSINPFLFFLEVLLFVLITWAILRASFAAPTVTVNDTHRENCVLHNLVLEFIKIEA